LPCCINCVLMKFYKWNELDTSRTLKNNTGKIGNKHRHSADHEKTHRIGNLECSRNYYFYLKYFDDLISHKHLRK
jgi:hypothetical protein